MGWQWEEVEGWNSRRFALKVGLCGNGEICPQKCATMLVQYHAIQPLVPENKGNSPPAYTGQLGPGCPMYPGKNPLLYHSELSKLPVSSIAGDSSG
mmetsp:Transcript_147334/g.257456  ORF Transcript_147334/g.257456 Transcript_147334/m.257456 type:complete len:96 (+) Transcript_147334:188-475(+)